jgi:hypothetical protein
VQYRRGSFTAVNATGNQSVNGVGFQGKAIRLWTTAQTAEGYTFDLLFGMGCATSSSARWAVAEAIQAASARRMDNTKVLLVCETGTGAQTFAADFVSFDADGFTINITQSLAAVLVHYEVATGNVSTNGVGFQPDYGFFMASRVSGALPGAATGMKLSFGSAVSASQQGASAVSMSNVVPVTFSRWQKPGAVMLQLAATSEADGGQAEHVSWDADGWTWHWTTALSAAHNIGYLAFKGGKYWVGTDTQSTATGTQTKTGVGFRPVAVSSFGVNAASSSTIDSAICKMSTGSSDVSNEGALWFEGVSGVPGGNRAIVSDKALRYATGASTTNAEADVQSSDADGYTRNWSTADATAREDIVTAFGSADLFDSTFEFPHRRFGPF